MDEPMFVDVQLVCNECKKVFATFFADEGIPLDAQYICDCGSVTFEVK